jgi:WD40 repeat protein
VLAIVAGPVTGNAEIYLVEPGTGKPTRKLTHSTAITQIGSLAFSRDGSLLIGATASSAAANPLAPGAASDSASRVTVWNVAEGTERWTTAVSRSISKVAFSPDARYIVLAASDRTLRILNGTTAQEEQRLVGHGASITAIAFADGSPDARNGAPDLQVRGRLLTAADDGTIRIWNLRGVNSATRLTGADNEQVQSVVVSPDQRIVLAQTTPVPAGASPTAATALMSGAGSFRAWDLETGRSLFVTPFTPSMVPTPTMAPFTVAGGRIAQARTSVAMAGGLREFRNELAITDASTGRAIATLVSPSTGAPAASNPSVIAVTAAVGYGLTTRGDRAVLLTLRMHMNMGSGRGAAPTFGGINGSDVSVWDVGSGKLLSSRTLDGTMGMAPRFSSDGAEFAMLTVSTAGDTGTPATIVQIYDSATGRLRRALSGSDEAEPPLVFNKDATHLAADSANNTVTIWDARTGKKLVTLPEHARKVTSMAFSPDGTRLVTVQGDGTLTLWDPNSGTHVLTLKESDGGSTLREVLIPGKAGAGRSTSVAFSEDGARIIVTSVTPEADAVRVQIRTWEGTRSSPSRGTDTTHSPAAFARASGIPARAVSGLRRGCTGISLATSRRSADSSCTETTSRAARLRAVRSPSSR